MILEKIFYFIIYAIVITLILFMFAMMPFIAMYLFKVSLFVFIAYLLHISAFIYLIVFIIMECMR